MDWDDDPGGSMMFSSNPSDTAAQRALPAAAWCWVPIRSLAAHHRPAIAAHLLALGEADRYLRFGHLASDAQIGRYVEHIDFEHDEVYGVFNRRLDMIAMAHLAQLRAEDDPHRAAEFGISVSASARGRGVGKQMFDLAVLRARNRGIDTLVVHALTENAAMLHIVQAAGATIVREGTDATARLRLPPEDLASQLGALAQQQVAEFDYGVKRRAHRVSGLLRLKGQWLGDS
jgi:RimJ/RimL family protein N-acetyltransferase